MNNKGITLAAALLATVSTANATLIDRGNGLIYDTDQNITWLQDANYAKTSGYDADGKMTWNQAVAWADGLIYGGYSDWRLPTMTDLGKPGCDYATSGTDCGYNVDTSSSELAYLWYDILGNRGYISNSGGIRSDGGLRSVSADGVSFINLPGFTTDSNYWTGTEYAPFPSRAWIFNTGFGSQDYFRKNTNFYAWAVRSGDIAVPEPATLLLLAAGLVGIAGVKQRRT